MAGEVMLESFLDACPGIYFVASPEGVITKANQEAAYAFGEHGAEGRSLLEAVHPEDRGDFQALWSRLPEDGKALRAVSRLRGADGRDQAFSWSARRVKEGSEIHAVLLPAAPAPAVQPSEKAPERILRMLLDNLEIAVSVVDRNGYCTLNEGKSLTTSGLGQNFNLGKCLLEAYAHDAVILENVERALRGEDRHYIVEAHGVLWENWFSPVKDENGEVIGAIGLSFDKSESKRAMQELQNRLNLIERQQEVIRNLETPIIEVWDRVVTLPMVGVVDSARAARVMDDLLTAVSRQSARYAILDLTGVEIVDTATAAHILSLISAIRLLGAEGIITGIRPTVAQTVVSLGLDLSRVITCANLREGLRLCIRRMHAQATADASVGTLV
ncbi:PAS domain-containing protein [Polyangium sp. y55x31]|uniref:PAS domain-containing protein n=1 Tax=Polyangium sp. y55x31 TaxID=3042688 RepID=UPI0024832A83|nr:PAS domain-containing protein [Polyangium sp. y55x31]MDI1477375.1 PAS domain-containing protein [Polyangium sp. y55x31]